MNQQYCNPPLVEAVCEFRFQGDQWDMAIPGLLSEKLKEHFPQRRQVPGFGLTIMGQADSVSHRVTPQDILQLRRNDDTALIQVGQHLLSVNHLRPYPGWAGYLPLIREGFAAYRGLAEPKGFNRIGLRYINRLDFPGPTVEMADYLDFYPFMGAKLPQDYFGSQMVVHVAFAEGRDSLRLRLYQIPPKVGAGQVSLHLDLDYFLGQPDKVSLDNVFEWLEEAHTRVEQVFEGCIKDSLRTRFNQEITL